VEVVAEVMGGAHNFLAERHTSRHLRAGEILVTRLAERGAWDSWDAGGRQGMRERAIADAERLLAEHQVPPLSDAQERDLDDIMKAAGRELA
jgi:trimethylamine:corrinoid methyltransferase-like protein